METKIHLEKAMWRLELVTGKALTSAKICLTYVKFRLNRHRPLPLAMIRALSDRWNLPADVLVREYDLTKAPTR